MFVLNMLSTIVCLNMLVYLCVLVSVCESGVCERVVCVCVLVCVCVCASSMHKGGNKNTAYDFSFFCLPKILMSGSRSCVFIFSLIYF